MPKTHGHASGYHSTRTYNTWSGMIQRCLNPNSPVFAYYGGRGIKVCKRWRSFEKFLQDMGNRPRGKQLDRKNNDGNYEPRNCRWITHFEQSRNFRRNVLVTVGKETMILRDWATRLGVNPENLRRWYYRGIWPSNFNYRGLWKKRQSK